MSHYVDPVMQGILDAARAAPAVDYQTMPIDVARETFMSFQRPWVSTPHAGVTARDLVVPGPAGPMAARLHAPKAGQDLPVIIFAHGGGWTFGSIESHHGTMHHLAAASGCAVLGIDYRLAPEHPFPAPLEDVLAALRFVEEGRLGAGFDPTRLGVAGDSAGANLALGAMLARRDAGLPVPRACGLFYGCFAPIFETESHRRFGDGSFMLSTAGMRWYWANFLGGTGAAPSPHAAPLEADLRGLPPLYLNAAGLDPLLDDTRLLSIRLAEAGVPHRVDIWPGVVHGFFRMARDLPPARAALQAAGRSLRDQLLMDPA